jgi:hypothetical protein
MKMPAPDGACDPNPSTTPAELVNCPAGTTLLPPSGSAANDEPVRNAAGSLACVAPGDGYICPARHNGTLHPAMCQIDFMCEDLYMPLAPCPIGTWTCLALNPQIGTAGLSPVLTHYNGSTVLVAPSDGLPWGWFPDLSPLGLELRQPIGAPFGAAPGSVLVPEAAPDLMEQCRNPGFLFSYDAAQVNRTFEAPGLGPPTAYGRCDAGATSRRWVYSEMPGLAMAPSKRWHEICSSIFWGDSPSQGAVHSFDWQALYTNVTGCAGQACVDAEAGPEVTACSPRCTKYGGAACSFSVDRYTPLLIHLAQLRVADVLTTSVGANASAQEAALMGVQAIQAAMNDLLQTLLANGGDPTDPISAVALVQAFIGSLDSVASAAAQVTYASGFVPAFSYELYNKKLMEYMTAFQRMMTSLQQSIAEDKLLSLFVAQIRTEQAQLSGEGSVTMETQRQTEATLLTALAGMQAASTGINTTGNLMRDAGEKFQTALTAWKTEQTVLLAFELAFMCADVFLGAGGAAAASAATLAGELKDTRWFKREATYYMFSVVQDVADFARDFVEAALTMADVRSQFPPELRDSSASFAADLSGMADLPPGNTSNGSVASLAAVAVRLSKKLPKYGMGYWSEYVAAAKTNYNPYLTGFNSDVNGAARTYIDHLIAQSNYGNDFVTEGTRYVSATQQYLINQAQMQAHNATQHAMNQAYDVVNEFTKYNVMQEGILSIQLTTLDYQMYATVQQLCQSYAYQSTRLYHKCVAPSEVNVLNSLCSAFSTEKDRTSPSLKPFSFQPCQSSIALANEAHAYLKQLEDMYKNAHVVNAYVTDAIWGTDASATDSPFISMTLRVYEPPECNGVYGFNETVLSMCSTARDPFPPPGVIYVAGTECLVPGASLPVGATCCNITRFNNNCTFDPPTNQPYMTPTAFRDFSDNTQESWGKLDFQIKPHQLSRLSSYDEVFVRGISVYLEGASIETEIANELNVRLEPFGQMVTRVLNQNWPSNNTCAAYVAEDPNNLCIFNNYSFVGAPSGASNTVSYTLYYSSPEPVTGFCDGNTGAQPVFYGRNNREITCETRFGFTPCFYYCTNLDFASLEGGDAKNFHTTSGPYNFASVYSSFRLVLSNKFGADRPVGFRSQGVQLQDVSAIHIGMWLKTNGRNSQQMDTCDDIQRKGFVLAQAAP